jgi:hypothetical protein
VKENVTVRKIGGKLYDVFVRDDGSITIRQIRDIRPMKENS